MLLPCRADDGGGRAKRRRGRCRRTEAARGPNAPSVTFGDTSPAGG